MDVVRLMVRNPENIENQAALLEHLQRTILLFETLPKAYAEALKIDMPEVLSPFPRTPELMQTEWRERFFLMKGIDALGPLPKAAPP